MIFPRISRSCLVLVCAAVWSVLALSACEPEPRDLKVLQVPTTDSRLGLPDRVTGDSSERTIPITGLLRVPDGRTLFSSPDSLVLVTTGGELRVEIALPALEQDALVGVRLRYRGTLGGELGIGFRQAGEKEFRRAQVKASVPGAGEEREVELGFGPTRVLSRRLTDVALMLPAGEVGTVRLAKVELVLHPGWQLVREDIGDAGGYTHEVLVPGAGRTLEWDVVVPHSGRLAFDYATRSEMWAKHGDGTRFVAELEEGGRVHRLMDRWLSPYADLDHRKWQSANLDLSAWQGKSATLRLGTIAGPDAHGIFPATADSSDDAPMFTVPRLLAPQSPRPNILLIVVDTLRRDALGIYGAEKGSTPHLDALAAEGVRFERAWAAGSWTHPSVAALLSGWNPSRHGLGIGPPGTTRLDPDTPLIAKDFQAAGWATAAVSNNRIVSVEEGFGRGFDSFDERPFVNDQVFGAVRVTRGGLEWIDDHAGQPFFLYLHYFDPHDRYQAPPPFTRMHVDPQDERALKNTSARNGQPNAFKGAPGEEGPERSALTPLQRRYLAALYAGEVSYVDEWIGKLVDGLRKRGLLENTLVVLTSDHGEEFLEHGLLKHGQSLYNEVLAVPLLLRLPGGRSAGAVVSEPVSLLDLAGTLRAFAGLRPPAPIAPQHSSWWSEGGQVGSPGGALIAENWSYREGEHAGPQRALIEWPQKLIEYRESGTEETFDLQADPGEHDPLAVDGSRARLTAVLDSLLTGSSMDASTGAPVDEALLEKLKALGYVH